MGADVIRSSDRGVTPLKCAALGGNSNYLETLLKANADRNASCRGGMNALFFAAY